MIQLKDVIHYYIGCDVIVDGKERGRLLGANPVPNSVGQVYWDIQTEEMQQNEDEDFAMPYNDDTDMGELRIKPILRQLEDITDEEVKEFIEWDKLNGMYLNVRYERIKNGIDIFYSIDAEDQGVYPQYYHITFHTFAPKEFQFLISRSFDLFGLLQSGQAINAKIISNGESLANS